MVQDFSHQRVLEIPHISWALIFVICHSATQRSATVQAMYKCFLCSHGRGHSPGDAFGIYVQYDFSDWNSSSKISRNMPKLFTHHFKFQTEFRIHFFHFLNPELSLKTSFVCFAFPQSSDQKGMDSRNRFPTSKWKYRLTLGRQTFHSQVGFSKGMITLRHYVHCTTLFLEQQVPIRKPALLRYCKKEFSHEYQIK